MDRIRIITLETDFGAGKKGAKFGPEKLLESLEKDTLNKISQLAPIRIQHELVDEQKKSSYLKNISSISAHLKQAVVAIESLIQAYEIPFIISGDHSNAIAGISALKNQNPEKKIGVIWMDAHADLHTPYTTPSGNVHGMPLAALCGISNSENDKNILNNEEQEFWNQLMNLGSKQIQPKIAPDQIVFIGLRDTEIEEDIIISKNNIRVYNPSTIIEKGIKNIYDETIAYLETCDLIYLSFDVDFLDPELSIGTGTPVTGGLSKNDAIFFLKSILNQPKLAAIEVTEINPLLDRNNPMETLIGGLLKEVWE